MKYAVEVAKAGSLNKAAETLLIAAPNVSRSIKELEADIGISIFERTAKGMELTPEGEEFINYAKGILSQIDEVENFYIEKKNIHAQDEDYIVNYEELKANNKVKIKELVEKAKKEM